jgi:hypothetical protein
LKEFGVLKDTVKGTSSPKNVQTISFEGIRLKEFEGIWSFFLCMLRVPNVHPSKVLTWVANRLHCAALVA